MSQEIIYTSAQKGLRSGSFGYCTVCSTGGMEPNMADFLEGISAYPHPYKPPDPKTKDNPVNYSHIIWTIGGQRFHVLSRVCDAGLDYTGRTNLLAHHVALTRREAEAAAGGPAWVLSDDNFTVSQWDGQLKTLPGRRPRTDDSPMEVCRAWQQAAGDAGYAGVLAESCLEKAGRPVTVIYKPGTDVLSLVREALSLLPMEKRWSVTFSTFYTKIYSSFECQWRFIFAGSPDAVAARKNPHSLVIDLAGVTPPKPANGGKLVAAARTGFIPDSPAAAPLAASSGVYVPSASRSRPPNLPAIPPPNPLGEHDPRLRPPEMVTTEEVESVIPAPNPFSRSPRKTSGMTLAVAFLGSLCVSLLAILGFMVFQKPKKDKNLAQVPPVNVQAGGRANANTHPTKVKPEKPPAEEKPNGEKHRSKPEVPTVVPEVPTEPPPAVTVPEPTKTTEPPPAVEPAHQPFDDLTDRKNRLRLPVRGGGGGLGATSPASNGPLLAKIYVPSPTDCELVLLGIEEAFGSGAKDFIVIDGHKDTPGIRSWPIIRKPTGTLSPKIETIGTFKLTGQDFSFHWHSGVSLAANPDKLRHCLVEVKVGSESRICRLSEPGLIDAAKFDKFEKVSSVKVDLLRVDSATLPNVENLLLQVKPVDMPGKVLLDPDMPLSPGKSQSIRILGGDDKEGPILEFKVTFLFDKDKDGQREIKVVGTETYKTRKITLEESLNISRSLPVSKIRERLADKQSRVANFETTARGKDTDLTKQKKKLMPLIDQKNNFIKISKDKEDQKAAERERDGYQEQLNRVAAAAAEAHKNVEEAKELEKQFRETLQLAQELVVDKKGSLEFRIFVKVDEEEVDLYRSKGFSRDF